MRALSLIYVRTNARPTVAGTFVVGPTSSVVGRDCPACGHPMEPAQNVAFVVIGPGEDRNALEKARAGGFHPSVAIPVHASCAAVDPGGQA